MDPQQTVYYRRCRFQTRLPVDRLFTPAHYWLAEVESGLWHIGLTKFATRMLGDLVEHDFNAAVGDSVEAGEPIGWIEGFKAISDIYCSANGVFAGGNPELADDLTLVERDLYHRGWLYGVRGNPGEGILDVNGYISLLDRTIDRMLRLQRQA
ncbi:MAG: glycine cleavage system protein H [Rhodopirellula sp.]|nr:glycine cleavage system protein H [Rhodopirellula sp.]